MKKIIQVLKSTTGKKGLVSNCNCNISSSNLVLYLVLAKLAIDYSTAVTTSDKAAVLEVRPHFYLPYLGILIQFSLGFGYVVNWLTRAIIGFKNSLKKRS